jgi:hypothetical protein
MYKFIFQVAIGLAIGSIGFFGNVIWESWRTKVDKLIYTVNSSDGILKGLKGFRTNAQFTMDTRQIDDFSLLEFKVYNTTGKNFSNVPLSIIIDAKRVEILSQDFRDKNGLKERGEVEFIGEDSVKGKVLFQYNLRIVNHNEDEPVATMMFVLGKPSSPESHLSVSQSGVEITKASVSDSTSGLGSEKLSLFHILLTVVVTCYMTIITMQVLKTRRDLESLIKKNFDLNRTTEAEKNKGA